MNELVRSLQAEHDHAWELINALTGGAGDDPPGPRRRQRLSRQLVSVLSAHELSEEIIMWPLVKRTCADGRETAAVGLKQEASLRHALNELSSISPPSQEFDECVNTVAGQARTHFSYEESQVWSRLEDALTPAAAEDATSRWRVVRAGAATKPHPHLPAEPRILGTLMPLLAWCDRTVNALSPQ